MPRSGWQNGPNGVSAGKSCPLRPGRGGGPAALHPRNNRRLAASSLPTWRAAAAGTRIAETLDRAFCCYLPGQRRRKPGRSHGRPVKGSPSVHPAPVGTARSPVRPAGTPALSPLRRAPRHAGRCAASIPPFAGKQDSWPLPKPLLAGIPTITRRTPLDWPGIERRLDLDGLEGTRAGNFLQTIRRPPRMARNSRVFCGRDALRSLYGAGPGR